MSTGTKERIKRIAKATYEYLFTTRHKRAMTGLDVAVIAIWYVLTFALFDRFLPEANYHSLRDTVVGTAAKVTVLVFGAQLL